MCWIRRPIIPQNSPAVLERACDPPLQVRDAERPHVPPAATNPIAKKHRRNRCKATDCSRRLRSQYETRCGLCVHHLRAGELLRDGVPSRFCQKCQKLQPVAEFEGDRKSCIEGLLRHNEKQRAARAAREGTAAGAPAAEATDGLLVGAKPNYLVASDVRSAQTAVAKGPIMLELQSALPSCWAALLLSRPLMCSKGADSGSEHSAQSPIGVPPPAPVPALPTAPSAPVPQLLELNAFVQELMHDSECDETMWWSLEDPASMPPVLTLPTLD